MCTVAGQYGRTHCNYADRGHLLRGFLHDNPRLRAVDSGFATCVADDGRPGGFKFSFLSWKKLQSPTQAVGVRKNLGCREICATTALVEHRRATKPRQSSRAERSGFLFERSRRRRCSHSGRGRRRITTTWTVRLWSFLRSTWGGSLIVSTESTRGQGRSFGILRTTMNPRQRYQETI